MHFINVSVVCTFFEALALFSRLVDSARNRGKQEKSSKSRCLLCSTLKPLISNMIGTLALSEPLFCVLVLQLCRVCLLLGDLITKDFGFLAD